MAGVVKKKPGDSSSAGHTTDPRHLVAPRQRGIPTRAYKDGVRQLDGNRNLKPTPKIQLSSSESLENKDHNLYAKMDNANAETGSVSRRSLSFHSSPATSVHKTNSVKLMAECDNRSQVTSTFVSDQDVSKPISRVKASHLSTYNPAKLRPVAKPNVELSSPLHNAHATESYHNSIKSPKRFVGNRNCLNKNINKVSSSDETCALKSTEELLCLNGASGKEISVSADHIAVRDELCNSTAVRLPNAKEIFVSDSSVISEPAVTGSCLKEISPEKANVRSLERAVEKKRLLRGRPGAENHGNHSNLRPQSSGGLSTLRKNQKFRQSTSNERPATSMPRCTNGQLPASDVEFVNSLEMEQEGDKKRKGSGGIKVSSLKEISGKFEEPNSPKFHSVARNQNAAAFGTASKLNKGLKNHVNVAVSGLCKGIVAPSRKVEVRSRNTYAKLSSVPKILISHDPQDLRTVPLGIEEATSGNLQKDEMKITICSSSPLSGSKAEEPPVNAMCPHDNRQAQPMVHTVNNGDANEDKSRRLFRSRLQTVDTDEHPKMSYVAMEDAQSNSWNRHVGNVARRQSSESDNIVVMDREAYLQMKDEFKALKATILQLQHVLIEGDTVESQIGDNNWRSPIKAHFYDGGDEATPTGEQTRLADICQENIRLQNKVDELEKLRQEQEQIIDILKQKSAPFDIRMLPEIESAASEADVELHHKNNCCATEHNVKEPTSSLPSCLTLTDESQSKVHLSNTVASPSSSPERTRFLHTTSVLHFAGKSEQCHAPISIVDVRNKACEMSHSCNDADEPLFSHDDNRSVVCSLQDEDRDVTFTSSDTAGLSKMFEASQSKCSCKVIQSGHEEEEFGEDYSMFDYNCSVDSDSEMCSVICEAPENISFRVADAGWCGLPFVSAVHGIPDGKLQNEEDGNHRYMASDSRPDTGCVGNAASCDDVFLIEADTDDNDVAGYAQTDQNCNERLQENGFCNRLGKFDESFSSNSFESPNCVGEERNIYTVLDSVESSSRRISEDSAYNLPIRQSVELWSSGDLKSENALIKQPPKYEISSSQCVPSNPVSGQIKPLNTRQTSQSSNDALCKVPNRTLHRMPKYNVSKNHKIEERTSGSSVVSVPPSGFCTASDAVHVVPEVINLNRRQFKEPSSSRLPSLRLSRVPKLPNTISK